MNKLLFCLTMIFVSHTSWAQDDIISMQTPPSAQTAFEAFLQKEKFGQDNKLKYEGIRNPLLRSDLSKLVNKIANRFIKISVAKNPTDYKYQKEIMYGLSSFNDVKKQLTKEDRARVAHYIIELMDIIGLKSSKGQLNMFVYGFDASSIKLNELEKN